MKKTLLALMGMFLVLGGCSSVKETSQSDTAISENAKIMQVRVDDGLPDELITTSNEDVYIQLESPTENASIYYTFDLKKKPQNFTLYTAPFKLPKPENGDATKQLRIFVVYGDFDEGTAYFKNFYYKESVTFSPFYSYFVEDIRVSLSAKGENPTIFYSLDETATTHNFELYTAPIELKGSIEGSKEYSLRAYAIEENGHITDVFTKTYVINYLDARPPMPSHTSGIYSNPFYLKFSNKTSDSEIYYTLDGSTPNATSYHYNDDTGILISEGITQIKAVRFQDQHKSSSVKFFQYKVDPNFVENYDYATLSFDEIVQNFVGNWVGVRYTPWVEPLSVNFVFRADGTYSSYSSPSSAKEGNDSALYYGTDKDSPYKTYELDSIDSLGRASGEIRVVFGVGTTNISRIKKVRFSENLDVLEFEYWHRDQYGPVRFKLYRF